MERVFNFNPGPAALPLEVLEQVQKELLNCQNTGMSILEMSHRDPVYEKINKEAQQDIKDLLGLNDDWCVLFMGGGATLQFSMVPMNYLTSGKVGAYIDTGNFSDKAIKEAKVEPGQWVAIYGAGDVGKAFKKNMDETVYAKVLLWVDRDYEKLKALGVNAPESLLDNKEVDNIIIAINNMGIAKEVKEYLRGKGVSVRL